MDEAVIPWSRVAAFVRQYTHDIRNGLNSLDLEASFLQDLVPDGEAGTSAARMRKQVRELAQQLRTLSTIVQEPSPIIGKLPAKSLMKIWREKHASISDAPEVIWHDQLGAEQVDVDVDVEFMAAAFNELLLNAMAFSPGAVLKISARSENGRVIFEMKEPKKEPVETLSWGQPFAALRHDHYGLGLWSAKRLLKTCNASFIQDYLPAESCLLTQIILPAV